MIRWLFENPCFVFDDLLVGLSLYKPQVGHLQEEDPDTPIKKQKKIKATSLAISLVITLVGVAMLLIWSNCYLFFFFALRQKRTSLFNKYKRLMLKEQETYTKNKKD